MTAQAANPIVHVIHRDEKDVGTLGGGQGKARQREREEELSQDLIPDRVMKDCHCHPMGF